MKKVKEAGALLQKVGACHITHFFHLIIARISCGITYCQHLTIFMVP